MVTPAPPAPFHLLLVEDAPDSAAILREMVDGGRNPSFKVAGEAASLQEALDIVAQNFNSIPIIRYAEVLLNYAEAKAELGT